MQKLLQNLKITVFAITALQIFIYAKNNKEKIKSKYKQLRSYFTKREVKVVQKTLTESHAEKMQILREEIKNIAFTNFKKEDEEMNGMYEPKENPYYKFRKDQVKVYVNTFPLGQGATNNPHPTPKEEYSLYKDVDYLKEKGNQFAKIAWPVEDKKEIPKEIIIIDAKGHLIEAEYIDIAKK